MSPCGVRPDLTWTTTMLTVTVVTVSATTAQRTASPTNANGSKLHAYASSCTAARRCIGPVVWNGMDMHRTDLVITVVGAWSRLRHCHWPYSRGVHGNLHSSIKQDPG